MLLTNGFIRTMEGRDYGDGYVLVREGKIAAVGAMDSVPAAQDDEVVDLEGKTLLPGFVDAHSHLGLSGDGIGYEAEDFNEDSEPCTPQMRALDAINPLDRCFAEAREAGVTTAVISPGSANPMGGQVCALKTAGTCVDQMAINPALAIKLALGENPKMAYFQKGQAPMSRMATAALIREQLHKARRYLQDVEKAEQNEEDLPEYDAKCEALLPLLRGEMAAHIHAHKAYDILTGLRIAGEFSLRPVIVHCTEGYEIAGLLGEKGVPAICGPMICSRTKPELAGLALDNCARLMQAGLAVAIATDHPEVPVHFLPLSASISAANGLTPLAALEAVTISAARAVGLEERVGSIAPGKDADLLAFTGEPLSAAAKPAMVWIDGKRVV